MISMRPQSFVRVVEKILWCIFASIVVVIIIPMINLSQHVQTVQLVQSLSKHNIPAAEIRVSFRLPREDSIWAGVDGLWKNKVIRADAQIIPGVVNSR